MTFLKRNRAVLIALGALLASGCNLLEKEPRGSDAYEIAARWGFTDSLEVVEVRFNPPGDNDIYSRFYFVNKLRLEPPVRVGLPLSGHYNPLLHVNGQDFFLAFADSPFVLVSGHADRTSEHQTYAYFGMDSPRSFVRAGEKFLFLGDSTLAILEGGAFTKARYEDFVHPDLHFSYNTAARGDTLVFLEIEQDTLCFYRKTGSAVRNFCGPRIFPPALPSLAGTDSFYVARDSVGDSASFRYIYRYALDFAAGKYTLASRAPALTAVIAAPGLSRKYRIEYSESLVYTLSDFR
jgi:hypothetical protein